MSAGEGNKLHAFFHSLSVMNIAWQIAHFSISYEEHSGLPICYNYLSQLRLFVQRRTL